MSESSRGMGSFGEVTASSRWSKTSPTTDWAPLVEEAKRLAPLESVPFAIGAIKTLRFGGYPVTTETVVARLRLEGRDMESMFARAAVEERENEGAA